MITTLEEQSSSFIDGRWTLKNNSEVLVDLERGYYTLKIEMELDAALQSSERPPRSECPVRANFAVAQFA